MKEKLFVLLACCLINSCAPDEPLINSFNDGWRLLVSGPQGLYTVEMPSGFAQPHVWKPAQTEAPYPISRILEYRDQLFAIRTTPEIVVLNRSSFAVDATISLESPAAGIAFGNATTAYVSLPDQNTVAVVDLTVMRVVGRIDVGTAPSDITAVGNQICVLLPQSNEAKIIDTRTNDVQATITLPVENPLFVGGDGLSGVFCVVMKGAGKNVGSVEPKSTPALSSIDILNRSITTTVSLTARESQGADQIPMGLAVNSNGFCYVPVQNGLLQVQTRAPRRSVAVQFDEFSAVWYDAARARILCLGIDGKAVTVYDEFAETTVATTTLPDSVNCIVGMAP